MAKKKILLTEDEKAELSQAVNTFQFETLEQERFPFVLIEGKQGEGKTHTACTVVETGKKVFFLDTENRGDIVVRKFMEKGIRYKKVQNYLELVAAVYALIQNVKEPENSVIIIDSGSDLRQYCEKRYMDWAKVEKIFPQVLWAKIYDMADTIITDILNAGFGLILTARMKEEYSGDKATGNHIGDVYKRVPYWADVHIRLNRFSEKPIEVLKNGYSNNLEFDIPRGTPIAEIISTIKS